MQKQSNKKFRIGIDARFYGPLGKGLGRYTQEIVDGVTVLDRHNEYVIFLSKDNFDEFIPGNKNVTKVLADIRWYTFAEQFVMPRLIFQSGVDIMHFPHFNVPLLCPVPFIVTVHDLILTKFPTTRASTLDPVTYFFKNLAYRLAIKRAVSKAEKVIAVSNYTSNDIIQQFKINPEKVEMIYEGVAELKPSSDTRFTSKLKPGEVLSGYCILEPYLLYVGNVYPHKNLESLINIFSGLRKKHPDLKLVVVGKDDYFYLRLKEYVKTQISVKDRASIIFPGYVPDKDLQTLFERAALYIFPSKYEGFGLPPLEAMSRGCPVVSSNATCLPEIMGSAALYFNPEEEKSMTEAIESLLLNPELRHELIKKGYEQIKKYNWSKASQKTLTVYQESLEALQ